MKYILTILIVFTWADGQDVIISNYPSYYQFASKKSTIVIIDTSDIDKMTEQQYFDFVTAVYFVGNNYTWGDSVTFKYYGRKRTYSTHDLSVNFCQKLMPDYMVEGEE